MIGGARAPYAVYLEFGTTKMAQRPYWSAAIEAVRPAWEARVAGIIAE